MGRSVAADGAAPVAAALSSLPTGGLTINGGGGSLIAEDGFSSCDCCLSKAAAANATKNKANTLIKKWVWLCGGSSPGGSLAFASGAEAFSLGCKASSGDPPVAWDATGACDAKSSGGCANTCQDSLRKSAADSAGCVWGGMDANKG